MPSFTKDAIKKTFMELLNKKPINKITVKDIAQECGINRNSFYYHFSDIPSLLEEIFTEEAERLINSDVAYSSIYEQLIYAIQFAIDNKTALYHIYNSANREMFEIYLDRISEKAVSDYIDNMSHNYNISTSDKVVMVLYYKCMLVGFVIDWLGSNMSYNITEKLKRICELFDGSMQNAFRRCEQRSKIVRLDERRG